MKIVSVFSVQFDNGYVIKNFGSFISALNFCRKHFPDQKVIDERYDEKKSLKNFY